MFSSLINLLNKLLKSVSNILLNANHSKIQVIDCFEINIELSPSSEQFIREDSKRPKVGGKVVTFVKQYLWSNILRSTTKCPRLVSKANVFGKPKVNLHIHQFSCI